MKGLLLPLLAVCSMAVAADRELDARFGKDVLMVVASEHACYRFDIYLALNAAQRARGLMHVKEMPATTGMLFVYEHDDILSMWMKNTYIPLDMLFVRADGTVASITQNTEPLSLRSVASVEPVRFVLELNAGTTSRLQIDTNSYIDWERDNE